MSKYGVFSGPYFPVFRLNTEIYSVNVRIRFEYRKIRTRKNSEFGHFLRSVHFSNFKQLFHCVKSVCIRNFSGPHFSAFGLNTDIYSVNLRIQSECGKMRTRKTPNTDTFYAKFILKDLKSKTVE